MTGRLTTAKPASYWSFGSEVECISAPWLSHLHIVSARPTRIKAPFTAGPWLSIYEACRLISGRPPHPPGLEVEPSTALILGGADKPGYHHQRPHARRGLAAFVAIIAQIRSGSIIADMVYKSLPTADTDGKVDWLNTKVRTSDVVAFCAKQGWRVRFEYPRPVKPIAPSAVEPTATVEPVRPVEKNTWSERPPIPAPVGRARIKTLSAQNKGKVVAELRVSPIMNCDKAIAVTEKILGLTIGQIQGRALWAEAGRSKPRGKKSYKLNRRN